MKLCTLFAALLALCNWTFVVSSNAWAHGGTDLAVATCDCEEEEGDDSGRTFDCEDEEGDDSAPALDCHDDEEGDEEAAVLDCHDEEESE